MFPAPARSRLLMGVVSIAVFPRVVDSLAKARVHELTMELRYLVLAWFSSLCLSKFANVSRQSLQYKSAYNSIAMYKYVISFVYLSVPDLAGSSHTSSRIPYPSRSHSQQSNYPSDSRSPLFQNGKRPFSGNLDYDSEAAEEAVEGDEGGCFVSQLYKQSLPAGDVKDIPGLTLLDDVVGTIGSCAAACCKMGPTNCQYLWIVKGKCLAVSCPEREREKCLPTKLSSSSSSNLLSTYLKMGYEGIQVFLL